MAKLEADRNNPVTYNICNELLLAPQFGIRLDTAELVASVKLSEEIRNRARNFV